jgi:hypothetical protein
LSELLGEELVYPGHPVPIALCVARHFESYETATYRSKGSDPSPLGAHEILGSGGCVYLAMQLLRKLHDGMRWDLAMTWADLAWGSVDNQVDGGPAEADPEFAPFIEGKAVTPDAFYRSRFSKGIEQARRTAPLLRELAPWWRP